LFQVFKRAAVYTGGQAVDRDVGCPNKQIVGPANETFVMVDGVAALALIDSGSQVSCISQSFHDKHLPHHEINPLEHLIHIESAGGSSLPYSGYVEVDLTLPGKVLGEDKVLPSIFLVTPDTHYNSHCPVLIGTNIIAVCYAQHNNFLVEEHLPSAWKVAFLCISDGSGKVPVMEVAKCQ